MYLIVIVICLELYLGWISDSMKTKTETDLKQPTVIADVPKSAVKLT